MIALLSRQQVFMRRHPAACRSLFATQSNVKYRLVRPDEAASICDFGRIAMTKTFEHMYPKDDFELYTTEAYSSLQYSNWIKEKGYFVHAGYDGDSIVGYVLAGPCEFPIDSIGAKGGQTSGQIHRIYVDETHFGQGIAGHLMKTALDWLRKEYSGSPIYLGAHPTNKRALNFYSKCGFEVFSSYDYTMGTRTDRDLILRL